MDLKTRARLSFAAAALGLETKAEEEEGVSSSVVATKEEVDSASVVFGEPNLVRNDSFNRAIKKGRIREGEEEVKPGVQKVRKEKISLPCYENMHLKNAENVSLHFMKEFETPSRILSCA